MSKEKDTKAAAAKTAANTTPEEQTGHFRNGHKWLAWITGITAVWTAVTFILGILGDVDLPRSFAWMNTWYLVNMAAVACVAIVATVSLLRKAPSLVFWTSTLMYTLILTSISLVIYYFYNQDTASINALAMLVWSGWWYYYLMTSPAVEADYPSVHRHHNIVGNIVLALLTLSTIAYGVVMAFRLLW